MKSYSQGRWFPKYWGWFEAPHDVSGYAAATFFSYEKTDAPGFRRKETLTSVIDLSLDLETIKGRMRKNFVVKQMERGERRGIVVSAGEDMREFYPLYAAFAQSMGFVRIPKRTLEENGILFLAQYEKQIIAAGVFIGDGAAIRAWVLASKRLGGADGRLRDVIGEANRLILWEAIRFAKAAGYRRFDLGGIAPDSDNAGWRAVAEFKEAFGGERIPAYYYHKVYAPLSRLVAKARGYLRP